MIAHWKETELENLFSFVIGGDWGKDLSESDPNYEEVFCIRGSEIRDWTRDKGKTAVLRKVSASSLEKRKLQEGDILIEISGGGPEQPVGRTVFIDEDVINFEAAVPKVCTNFLRLVRLADSVDKKFMHYFLTYFYHTGEIVKYQGGSNNLRNLRFKEFSTIKVPLAPLPEQKRIVAKLDTLFAHLDQLKARLEKIPTLLKQFRQAVLTQAVTGKLTEKWREISFQSGQKGINELVPGKEKNDFEVPIRWKWVRIEDVATLINGDRGINYPNVKEYVPKGVPWINTGHIDPDGSLSSSRMNFITRKKFDSLGSGKTKKGDLVYCLRGATLGKTAIVEYDEGAIASSLVIIRPHESVLSKFIYYLLVSPFGTELIGRFDNGTAQPNLAAKSVKQYPVPLPPLEEQQEIVCRVELLFAIADKIEASYKTLQEKIDQLPQAILSKAFRGELVKVEEEAVFEEAQLLAAEAEAVYEKRKQ